MPHKHKATLKRVFINNIDSYSSRNIAKFLCKVSLKVMDEEEEQEEEVEEAHHNQAFQMVGTVSNLSDEPPPYILEEYCHPGKEELLSILMECHVILYNISQDADQVEEASWAVKALHDQKEDFTSQKIFVLISTVMTWASSIPLDPEDPELPFTDEIFYCRKAHPSFKKHIDLEKIVVKVGKSNREIFSTYVVASGLQYGMGEGIFHFFFKESWLGEATAISIYGDGKNIIPTIHVSDLASVVQNVIEHQPRPYYLLAVDMSNNTMEELVKVIANVLGPANTVNKPFEDIYLNQELTVMEIDSLQVNLRMEATNVENLFSVHWHCEAGLVENVDLVVEEYRLSRGLLPLRICLLGPPAVGKTTLSSKICKHYKLHHITVRDTIYKAMAELEVIVKNPDPDAEEVAAEAQELLNTLNESIDSDDFSEEQLKVLRDKMMSNQCKNQGYVLDAFPTTYKQAEDLFEDEQEDLSEKFTPEFLLVLDATDSFLTDRVINLSEETVQDLGYEPEKFLSRLAIYRDNIQEEKSVISYFEELDVIPVLLEATNGEEPATSLLMHKIFTTLGPPRTYSPSPQEVKEEETRIAEEKMKKEAEERAVEEQKEEEEARNRTARWEEWTQSSEEARMLEELYMDNLTDQMRSYLMKNVVPTLGKGLIECCRTQPAEPLDFLAEFLFRNNPHDHPPRSEDPPENCGFPAPFD
ncbi:adenylate kinase 7 isoform X1 [Gambusia affinis]|uniref:adenylate kinase 7 isoform X1 n=2 Tax=Gambusia affinis TaxID=33528 RepID=UPI001CDC4ACD|nr:adenylate kinase 7 isoform X1 [Gambusia affinis]